MTRRMKPLKPAEDYRPSDHAIDDRHVLAGWLLVFAVAVIAIGVPQLDAAVGETGSYIGRLPGVLTAASGHQGLDVAAGATAMAAVRE
jgi:hypothetical protein